MGYLILYAVLRGLFFPFLKRSKKGGLALLIHTGKIGDYANAVFLLEKVAPADVLLDRLNAPFVSKDQRIRKAWFQQDYKANIWKKCRLACQLYCQGYERVFITTPNQLNLFWGLCACAGSTSALDVGWGMRILLKICDRVVPHDVHTPTIDSYLKLADGPGGERPVGRLFTDWNEDGVVEPLRQASRPRVGVSLCTGNGSKQIPVEEWGWWFQWLKSMGVSIVVLGTEPEQVFLDSVLQNSALPASAVLNLLGAVPLRDLPENISQLDILVSADSGPAYLAGLRNVPLVLYAGPCYLPEQQPQGNNHHIVSPQAPVERYSYIFDALHNADCETLYKTNVEERRRMMDFVRRVIQK
ncbi:MAG: glycosyltransferase family 9 protein [Candidatus Methylacidiphilales bacterium]|nr:glycosyltransferase family 9 protein [Candidatus Methylacidiphilales bacterium]